MPDVLALPIIQQPAGNAGFVSNNDGEATQFSMASQSGNIGLLAHNHLAGKTFSGLAVGQEVRLVYGTGRVEYFVIKEVLKYQALQPSSPSFSQANVQTGIPRRSPRYTSNLYRSRWKPELGKVVHRCHAQAGSFHLSPLDI